MNFRTVVDWPVLAACISSDRAPDPSEFDHLASRIWHETHPGECDWSAVPLGSDDHRRTMAIVRAAVGLPDVDASSPPGGDEGWNLHEVLGMMLVADELEEDRHRRDAEPKSGDVLSHPSDEDYVVLAAFRRDIRKFLRFSEKAAEDVGITIAQYQVLLALRAAPDRRLSIGELAEEMLLAPNSASGLLSRLEATGFVKRSKPRDDGRRVEIVLTQEGCNFLDNLAQAHRVELMRLQPMLDELLEHLNLIAPKDPAFSRQLYDG